MTENGVDCPNADSLRPPKVLNDTFRIQYYASYLEQLHLAISEDGIPVTGYMAWSILDNYEWHDGYSKLFGLTFIDRENNLTRTPKESSKWFSDFLVGQ